MDVAQSIAEDGHGRLEWLENALAGSFNATGGGTIDPYRLIIQHYRDIVYPTPTALYKPRLIVLGSLLIYMALAAVVFLYIQHLLQKEKGDRIWLYRLVKREDGRFIIGNPGVIIPCFTITIFFPLLANVLIQAHVYLHGGPEKRADIAALVVWPVYFFGSWGLSCASLQAWLITGGNRKVKMSPLLLNTLFLGILIGGTAVLISLAVVGAQRSIHSCDDLAKLLQFLESASRDWNGTLDLDVFRRAVALSADYERDRINFHAMQSKILFVFAASLFCIAMANLAIIFLIILVRRQVAESRETLHFNASSTRSATGNGGTESVQLDKAAARTSAQQRMDDGQKQRLKHLRQVERELMIACFMHYIYLLALFIAALWSGVNATRVDEAGWVTLEAMSLLPAWITCILLCFALTRRAVVNVLLLRAQRREKAIDKRAAITATLPPALLTVKVERPSSSSGSPPAPASESEEGTSEFSTDNDKRDSLAVDEKRVGSSSR